MVEIASEHLRRFGHGYRDVRSFFDAHGYETFVIEHGALRPVPPGHEPDCVNLFFKQRS